MAASSTYDYQTLPDRKGTRILILKPGPKSGSIPQTPVSCELEFLDFDRVSHEQNYRVLSYHWSTDVRTAWHYPWWQAISNSPELVLGVKELFEILGNVSLREGNLTSNEEFEELAKSTLNLKRYESAKGQRKQVFTRAAWRRTAISVTSLQRP